MTNMDRLIKTAQDQVSLQRGQGISWSLLGDLRSSHTVEQKGSYLEIGCGHYKSPTQHCRRSVAYFTLLGNCIWQRLCAAKLFMKSNDPDTSWQVKDFNDVLQKEVDQNLNRLYDGVFHKVGRSSKFPLHPDIFWVRLFPRKHHKPQVTNITSCWSTVTSSSTTWPTAWRRWTP